LNDVEPVFSHGCFLLSDHSVIVLLDTHVLVWWMTAAKRLSSSAREILADRENQILISAATAWELAIKAKTGKFHPSSVLDDLPAVLVKESFSELGISMGMAIRAGLLPPHHRDPFDRMLAAQAQELNIPILSGDVLFDRYGINRLW
jgi:PIN domain nuclease of toxin-antitoxin system